MTLGLILLSNKDSEAVHLALFELSDIDIAVSELKFAFTIFLAISVMPLILTAIGPLGFTLSFNATLNKLSGVGLFALLEVIRAITMEETVEEGTLIVGAIIPLESARPILLAIYELSLIGLRSIIPNFSSEAMLLVVFPLSFILAAVDILECPVAVRFALTEVALIVFTICENFSAIAMRKVIMEISLILSSIRPEHDADTVLNGGLLSQPKQLI
jgi:hypothetical protein